MRRATLDGRAAAVFHLISIHALREEGDHRHRNQAVRDRISIHALREEGDNYIKADFGNVSNFYPRPP